MPREAFSSIYELAADQFGYFTTAQAHELGVDRMAVVMMERRGTIERVSRGVYRLLQFPVEPEGQYMEASLWPRGTTAVVSHESALALFELSDVDPVRIHITVPKNFRVRRGVPARLAIHHADLPESDQTLHNGIPVTTVSRTLRDCRAAKLGNEVLRTALLQAEREGWLTRADAAQLYDELGLTHENEKASEFSARSKPVGRRLRS
ncbi:MAG TPA: type IV toxin-antitoxin system AbiEi family antitoxin domain-containing protein [Longimicrobium sp.]|jgi:predicted transcriptional regulator of viral defense system